MLVGRWTRSKSVTLPSRASEIRGKSNPVFAALLPDLLTMAIGLCAIYGGDSSLRSLADICDQTIALNGFYAAKHYPGQLRRIRYRDPETGKNLVFLTNQFALPAPTICALYRCRWQVELFFKWIKQHLRIKRFYGTSENAVRTQIWIAISVYVLVAIIKKQLRLDVSLHALLQILSLTLFEKLPLKQAVASVEPFPNNQTFHSQLNLFEWWSQGIDATLYLGRPRWSGCDGAGICSRF